MSRLPSCGAEFSLFVATDRKTFKHEVARFGAGTAAAASTETHEALQASAIICELRGMICVVTDPGPFAAIDRKTFKHEATQPGAGAATASIEGHETLQARAITCELWDMIGVVSEPGLFVATDRKTFKQDAAQSGACTATAASIEAHEALQASAIICELWDMIGVATAPGLVVATDRKTFKQDAAQPGAGTAAASIEAHEALQASAIICKLWDMIGVATEPGLFCRNRTNDAQA